MSRTLYRFVVAYLLFLSSLILVGGVLGDMYGRRRIFALGVGIFGATSIWCGLAPDPTQLIFARSFQGVGAALLVPGSLTIITAYFPESERGKAIGWWSAFSALLVAVGPVLGGWFVDQFTWRLVFFINVPLTVFVLWMVAVQCAGKLWRIRAPCGGLDRRRACRVGLRRPVIWADLGRQIRLCSSVGGGGNRCRNGGFGGLRCGPDPGPGADDAAVLVQIEKLRWGQFADGVAVRAVGRWDVVFAYHHDRGLWLLCPGGGGGPAAGGIPVGNPVPVGGGLINRTGATIPLVVGPIIAALGWGYFALPWFSGNYWTTFFPGFVLLGLGMSIAVAPLTTVVMTAFDQGKAGVASGINNAASRASGLVAVALFGALVTLIFNAELASAVAAIDLPAAALAVLESQDNLLTAAQVPDGLAPEMAVELEAAIDNSFLAGYRAAMWLSAGLAAASAVFAAAMIRYKPEAQA